MAAALARLDRVLPADVRASLRPPVLEADLDAVRRAVEPFQLPDDVVSLWRWADGQEFSARLAWPMLDCGPLSGAASAAESYRWLCTQTGEGQWNPLWLPVARAEHLQAGVEMTVERPGVVIDASFGAGVAIVRAPSLAAVLDGTAQLLEAGHAFSPPPSDRFAEWRARQATILDAAPGWERWPYDRMIAPRVDAWPRHWRAALGLPPEPDAPRREPTPIASLPVPGPVTIEGHITDRQLVDGTATGDAIIPVKDATGALRVLVRPHQPGRIWTSPLGLRIQVDTAASDQDPAPADELRIGVQL
jgi:hypothetical protein